MSARGAAPVPLTRSDAAFLFDPADDPGDPLNGHFEAGASPDLLEYYSANLAPDTVDLSTSSSEASHHVGPAPPALGYTPPTGAEQLRSLIASRYRTLGPEHVVLTSGASEALAAVCHALVAPGTRVLQTCGAYPSFRSAVARQGGVAGDLASASIWSVSNPTTPGGSVLDLAEHRNRDVRIISDEVYADLARPRLRPVRAADLRPDWVSVGGLSKAIGAPGLRIGWVATRDADLTVSVDREVQLLSGGPASPSCEMAAEAMLSIESEISRSLAAARANAPGLLAVLDAFGWRYRLPRCGLTLVAAPEALDELALRRLSEIGLFLLPTSVYGLPGAVRISMLAEPRLLEKALLFISAANRRTRPG